MGFNEATTLTKYVYDYLSKDEYADKSEVENIAAYILRQIAKEIENV
jgi:hypothetical protein